ncbi:MAG: RNA binding S1 domain protein [Parcubacteria group bacterium GW2011_GWE2_39_37]|uniref:RNA binding S1 domain protein n=1 Tax=Candidatus Falkowbacteria bacterium GW2011_GWF2_39_8 TaxID=1618642 RepID=A0A0G0PYN9_9BACT|nr:MAG: RNA binding S1 domain protein [Parcubacteria group bacterium GW2011_GWE2_39_37]KKR33013.1 MAG: RNA binding S1 domain protein [Candidatus Falkowbacteria bacterium GW2011_GWF2_39_8]
MTEEKNEEQIKDSEEFANLLSEEKDVVHVPQVGEIIKGTVLSASKAEVRLDIDGTFIGVVRGRELYDESPEYSSLKPGDEIEATVIEEENENGNIELSFRYAGQEKAWAALKDSFENKTVIKVRVIDANRGGLLANFGQIAGFLPVSQLAPENYPRVSGGDKSRILEKLKSFVGMEMEVRAMNLDEKGEKIIFSEKEAWNERQRDVIAKYKVGSQVTGKITAVTDFGVFISFGDNLEGLIHISELAWQRIEDPADLFKVGQEIAAEIINIDGSKIFLSAKKLAKDPWAAIAEKFNVGQTVKATILKVNPFGLFVKLNEDIHGLAHISQLALAPGQKLEELYRANEEAEFKIISIEPKEHRLGLAAVSVEVEKAKADEGEKVEKKAKTEKTEKVVKEKKVSKKKSEEAETATEEKE